MGTFVKHSPCPKCGSRDNLAIYSDGSGYCFGCGYWIPSNISPYINYDSSSHRTSEKSRTDFPKENSDFISEEGIKWANSFGITLTELLARRVTSYSDANKLLFNFFDNEGERILCQARNLNPMAKPKYITYGKTEDVLPIYYQKTWADSLTGIRRCLVITEDCLSAIKIARQSDAMPALSSDLPLAKLNRLARLYGAFLIWLDGDMFHKAQRIARRLQLLGCEAQAVYTPLDPKCYDNATIRNVLLTGKLETC